MRSYTSKILVLASCIGNLSSFCVYLVAFTPKKEISIRERTWTTRRDTVARVTWFSCRFFSIFRLQEALIYKNERQISHICKLLIKHFDFDPLHDIKRGLEKANQETLLKSDLPIICMYGLDLSRKKNLKKLLALLCRCPKVKKIELMFCTLNHENVLKLFEATMKLESLYYLGR